MSGILIKDTEMPKNCRRCFAVGRDDYRGVWYCHILKANVVAEGNLANEGVERDNRCPLVELPFYGTSMNITVMSTGAGSK